VGKTSKKREGIKKGLRGESCISALSFSRSEKYELKKGSEKGEASIARGLTIEGLASQTTKKEKRNRGGKEV